MTAQESPAIACSGAGVVPTDRIFHRNSKVRVIFSGDGEALHVEEVNPLEDWPGWE